jgi:hypothetical protein
MKIGLFGGGVVGGGLSRSLNDSFLALLIELGRVLSIGGEDATEL